jgi:hypothetical protein
MAYRILLVALEDGTHIPDSAIECEQVTGPVPNATDANAMVNRIVGQLQDTRHQWEQPTQ